MNMKNIALVVIRQEPEKWGRHINGGDYGFSQIYSRSTPNHVFEIEYRTTSEISYCPLYGVFQPCENCRDWDRKEKFCYGEPEEITVEELEGMVGRIAAGKERLLHVTKITEFEKARKEMA